MNILNNGRFGMGACLTGTMKMLIAKAAEHANSRKQFVSKLREYQGIQEKIAKMNLLCYANEVNVFLSRDITVYNPAPIRIIGGGVQPHFSPRHSEIWIWGWGKMGKKVYEKRRKQSFYFKNRKNSHFFL